MVTALGFRLFPGLGFPMFGEGLFIPTRRASEGSALDVIAEPSLARFEVALLVRVYPIVIG